MGIKHVWAIDKEYNRIQISHTQKPLKICKKCNYFAGKASGGGC